MLSGFLNNSLLKRFKYVYFSCNISLSTTKMFQIGLFTMGKFKARIYVIYYLKRFKLVYFIPEHFTIRSFIIKKFNIDLSVNQIVHMYLHL